MIWKTSIGRKTSSAILLCEQRNATKGMLILFFKWISALTERCLPKWIYQICRSSLNYRGAG